jgi:hypothetical protein
VVITQVELGLGRGDERCAIRPASDDLCCQLALCLLVARALLRQEDAETRDILLERVWTNDIHVTERSVDTLVKRLRQKIEIDPGEPALILTVWGTGYKFSDA